MGFPRDIYPVLYAIPRMAGWMAHWTEVQSDPQQRLVRPRQHYKGYGRRLFQELGERKQHPYEIEAVKSKGSRRREAAERFEADSK
jgi:citrate synthase